jgi:hypothetical protein
VGVRRAQCNDVGKKGVDWMHWECVHCVSRQRARVGERRVAVGVRGIDARATRGEQRHGSMVSSIRGKVQRRPPACRARVLEVGMVGDEGGCDGGVTVKGGVEERRGA